MDEAQKRRMLDSLAELCDELGRGGSAPDAPPSPAGEAPQDKTPLYGRLSDDDERLLSGLRSGLARLAGDRRPSPAGGGSAAVRGALDGAETVARCEIMTGQGERLPQLLPGFAFLAVLPAVGRSEALRISRRAVALLEG